VDDYTGYAKSTASAVYDKWVDDLAESTGLRLMNDNWFQGTRQMFGIKLLEVSSNVAFTNHIQLYTGLVTSATWFEVLPDDRKTIPTVELAAACNAATAGTMAKLAEVETAGAAFNGAREALQPYLQ
jgi:hypothetical protein